MTATDETVDYHGHRIVDCGWLEPPIEEHGPSCERCSGSLAVAATEPNFDRTQFWCSVIHPFLHGPISRPEVRDAQRYRDGVQLTVNIWDAQSAPDYREQLFNLTAGEARQLAAQLVAAADSHDGINESHHVLRRIDKIAKKIGLNGMDIYGP
jgi:hypothetical protein